MWWLGAEASRQRRRGNHPYRLAFDLQPGKARLEHAQAQRPCASSRAVQHPLCALGCESLTDLLKCRPLRPRRPYPWQTKPAPGALASEISDTLQIHRHPVKVTWHAGRRWLSAFGQPPVKLGPRRLVVVGQVEGWRSPDPPPAWTEPGFKTANSGGRLSDPDTVHRRPGHFCRPHGLGEGALREPERVVHHRLVASGSDLIERVSTTEKVNPAIEPGIA